MPIDTKPIEWRRDPPPPSSGPRFSLVALALLVASVVVFLSADIAAGTPGEAEWRWRGAVSAHKQIQVLAVRGPLRVEGYDGDAVDVVARRRSTEVDPEVVQIVLKETANQFQLITEYPPPPLGPPRECLWYDPIRGNFWDYFVTVDLSVKVPRGHSISVHTYAGDITAMGLEGSVVLGTNDGTIRLGQLDGEIEARAEGDIVADLRQGGLRRGSILLSVNGDCGSPGETSRSAEVRRAAHRTRPDQAPGDRARRGAAAGNGRRAAGRWQPGSDGPRQTGSCSGEHIRVQFSPMIAAARMSRSATPSAICG